MTTLIATLGSTWQVIPEIVGLVLPDACPLYQHHPQQAQLANLRESCGSPKAADTRLWIVTSSSLRTAQGIDNVRQWNAALRSPLDITFFVAADTDEVTSEGELKSLQELVLRVMLAASSNGDVICSLAGGRKTMSADLQYAASLFGARALLHVVAPEPMPDELRDDDASFWANPLHERLSCQLLPAFIGSYERRDMLDIEPPFSPQRFPLPISINDYRLIECPSTSLSDALAERERDAGRLLSNYLSEIARAEKHENWRHLYRLPPRLIERLRKEKVCNHHEALIRSLPKAELHCHLGGLPDLEQQIAIGQAVWRSLTEPRQSRLKLELQTLITAPTWPWDWPQEFLRNHADPVQRAERAACLLAQASHEQLQANLFLSTEPRIALCKSMRGFSAYERPGELTGSSVLGHPSALPAYCQAIHDYTARENIVYLELRGSPHKYDPDDPLKWLTRFSEVLKKSSSKNACEYRFIWILDRRQPNLTEVVQYAVNAQMQNSLTDFVVGLDLAGDESHANPEALAPAFQTAFAHCLPLTIHAGEGQPADSIWQAAYHLHADRIGHGLTLIDKPELLTRFRNRNVCLELCPTSNIEVIGFQPPAGGEVGTFIGVLPKYPIESLWSSGVPLTINTDNPGISRTGLTREYLVAAELWGDMPLWDCLAMVKQGFVHAMAPAETRERLLKHWDAVIHEQLSGWLMG